MINLVCGCLFVCVLKLVCYHGLKLAELNVCGGVALGELLVLIGFSLMEVPRVYNFSFMVAVKVGEQYMYTSLPEICNLQIQSVSLLERGLLHF